MGGTVRRNFSCARRTVRQTTAWCASPQTPRRWSTRSRARPHGRCVGDVVRNSSCREGLAIGGSKSFALGNFLYGLAPMAGPSILIAPGTCCMGLRSVPCNSGRYCTPRITGKVGPPSSRPRPRVEPLDMQVMAFAGRPGGLGRITDRKDSNCRASWSPEKAAARGM